MYAYTHAHTHAGKTWSPAPFLSLSFFYITRSRRVSFMTIYLTIDNNKFGSYLDYPPDVRNYKRLLITNVLMYSFLHAWKRPRPSSARGIGGPRALVRWARVFPRSGRHIKKHPTSYAGIEISDTISRGFASKTHEARVRMLMLTRIDAHVDLIRATYIQPLASEEVHK